MLNDHQHPTGYEDYPDEVRDIHALTPPQPQRRDFSSNSRSSSLSVDAENFTTMSREFNALVVAGTTLQSDHTTTANSDSANLRRIGEEELLEENPLAIVADINPIASPSRNSSTTTAAPSAGAGAGASSSSDNNNSVSAATAPMEEVSVHLVKKEEVVSKIVAWETAEVAKVNNKFKREEVVLRGWESEQVENATALFKKAERKLEEKRAKAVEKMQNEVAKAHRKAEEKRASAEAKRGTKVAKIKEMANLLRAVGRAPSKRSIF